MTAAAPSSPHSPVSTSRRAGDVWRGGSLCDREARPVLPDPSYPDLLPQVVRQGAKPVWLSTPAIGSDHCGRFYAAVFRRAIEGVGHPQAQEPAWPRYVAFESILSPGHAVPHRVDGGRMMAGEWEWLHKSWEDSHGP